MKVFCLRIRWRESIYIFSFLSWFFFRFFFIRVSQVNKICPACKSWDRSRWKTRTKLFLCLTISWHLHRQRGHNSSNISNVFLDKPKHFCECFVVFAHVRIYLEKKLSVGEHIKSYSSTSENRWIFSMLAIGVWSPEKYVFRKLSFR